MWQTYFCNGGKSRNGYVVICGAEIIFDDQSDFVRSIAPQSIVPISPKVLSRSD
jgi:hypothetical protein